MDDRPDGLSLRSRVAPVIAVHVCLHGAMTGARMSAPLFALHTGMGPAAAGLLVALFSFTQLFLSLPAGRFADRNGLKRPVRWAIGLTVASIGLAALWPVYGVLCVTAIGCGGAVGAATIALQRHAGRLGSTPEELRAAFSWISLAPAISNFVGPFAAGWMIEWAGYRAAFAMLALMPLVAWLILFKVREATPGEPVRRQSAPAWDLLRGAHLRRLLVMSLLFNIAWDLHGFMVPMLAHERGLSASVTGSILGTLAIAAALTRLLMPLAVGRIREWAMITGGTTLAGLSIFGYPWSQGPWTMGVLSFLLGIALGLVQPMLMAMLHQIVPLHRQGEALGLRLIQVNFSGITMPLLFGALGGAAGAATVFWLVGAIVGVGSLLGFSLRGAGEGERPH